MPSLEPLQDPLCTPSDDNFKTILCNFFKTIVDDNTAIHSSIHGINLTSPTYDIGHHQPFLSSASSSLSLPDLLSSSSSICSSSSSLDAIPQTYGSLMSFANVYNSFGASGELLPPFDTSPLQLQQDPNTSLMTCQRCQMDIKPQKRKVRVACPLCTKTFTRRTDLKRHKNEIHGGNISKYWCIYGCGSSFVRKHDCQRHVRVCKLSPPK